jgi:hypothetical protein
VVTLPAALAERRTLHLLDALALAWFCLWVGIGYWVYHSVEGLASISHTVVLAGQAINATADALGVVGSLPLVGGQLGSLVRSAHQAANSAIYNGNASRSDIDTLAALLWACIALAPTTPLLVLYGLLRRGWRRDVASIRALAATVETDSSLERFLARRALENLPYRRLLRISSDPWGDYEQGRTSALARAELARLGLRADREPDAS